MIEGRIEKSEFDNLKNKIDALFSMHQATTFKMLDALDFVGLTLAKHALDPSSIQESIHLVSDMSWGQVDDHELAILEDYLMQYKLKSSGLRQYIQYKLDSMV